MTKYHPYWRAPLEQPPRPGGISAALDKLTRRLSHQREFYRPVDEAVLRRTRSAARVLGLSAMNNNGTVHMHLRNCIDSGWELNPSEASEHDSSSTGVNPFPGASISLIGQAVLGMANVQPHAQFAVFSIANQQRLIKMYPGGFNFVPDPERSRREAAVAAVRWLMPEAVDQEPDLLSVPDIVVGSLALNGSFLPGPHAIRIDEETGALFKALDEISQAGTPAADVRITGGMVVGQ